MVHHLHLSTTPVWFGQCSNSMHGYIYICFEDSLRATWKVSIATAVESADRTCDLWMLHCSQKYIPYRLVDIDPHRDHAHYASSADLWLSLDRTMQNEYESHIVWPHRLLVCPFSMLSVTFCFIVNMQYSRREVKVLWPSWHTTDEGPYVLTCLFAAVSANLCTWHWHSHYRWYCTHTHTMAPDRLTSQNVTS